MLQNAFFSLLIITLIAGTYSYLAPAHQEMISPMKFVMDKSGFNDLRTLNHQRTEQINMMTSKGMVQMRMRMQDIATEQNNFLDTVRDQQRVLDTAMKTTTDTMQDAQNKGEVNYNDIMRFKSLTSQIQDQQSLMISRGQNLIAMNNQISRNRQWISEQTGMARANTEAALSAIKQRYAMLEDQSTDFFDKVRLHNQDMQDRLDKIRDKLYDMVNNGEYESSVKQKMIKDRIQSLLDKEHEDMLKLAESEERGREFMLESREKAVDAKEQLDDSLQKNRDLIDNERQKEEDLQAVIQQRMADQQQRIQDLQDRQNL